ncbi:MAG TPA: urea transporter [Chitinophagales bacterium]|nr:urea transporter [Chitinophagales bacterium]
MPETQTQRPHKFYSDSIINSYSQMFFSDNRVFAYLILLGSFINPYSGLAGLFAVVASVVLSRWLGFDRAYIRAGSYSSNALMVGLVMGLYFTFSIKFFVILFVVSLLCTVLVKAIAAVFTKYGIPVLSFPFLLTTWALLLALRSSTGITLSDNGLYIHNELYSLGGIHLVQFYEWLDNLQLPRVIDAYLKSLGAIYFQYNILSGFIIAVGLLIYSRIAFTLSVIGFASGYFFFQYMNGTAEPLNYNFIGFNYILASISIGGFYLIPSKKSYLLVLLIAPVIAVLHTALGMALDVLQLPVYSLPFNLVLLLLLLTLKYRTEANKLELVWYQQFSPEKNLYKHRNNIERFSNQSYFHIQLPFFGDWYVSQGHDGAITHLGEWKYAWDFVVTDDLKKTFRLPGNSLSDFYCYNAPILAPAAGYVYNIIDEVDDNPVGGVDVINNWGNTIIIKHSDYLYSKLSHIKRGSFKVRIGDYVNQGDLIANCGNSGRSPEPHIHFQLQATPHIGSKTLNYPISYFVEKKADSYQFHSFEVPQEGSTISGIQTTGLLRNAFAFVPGQELKFEVSGNGEKEIVKWEVFTDAYNGTYIYCHNTRSVAYFVNNGTLHYFTEFTGDRASLLWHFYIGARKILLGYYENMEMQDVLPMTGFYSGLSTFIQDFVAPFNIYLKGSYTSRFTGIDDANYPKQIAIASHAKVNSGATVLKEMRFEFTVAKNKIQLFKVLNGNQTITATCID